MFLSEVYRRYIYIYIYIRLTSDKTLIKAPDLPKLYRPTSHKIKLTLQGSRNYPLMSGRIQNRVNRAI